METHDEFQRFVMTGQLDPPDRCMCRRWRCRLARFKKYIP